MTGPFGPGSEASGAVCFHGIPAQTSGELSVSASLQFEEARSCCTLVARPQKRERK